MVAFIVVLTLYFIVEANRPRPVDWTVTLSKEDKNPYGSYVLYNQLKNLFPGVGVTSYRLPVYDQVADLEDSNTAYVLIAPQLRLSHEDVDALLTYVVTGNYVFLASDNIEEEMMDSLKLKISSSIEVFNKDSTTINFVNPALKAKRDYGFKRMTLDGYLGNYDTAHTIVLGTNQSRAPVFVKIPYGEGAFLVNVNPLCFSNYFMLTGNNADYTAKALSYIPGSVDSILWDEFYKMGPEGSGNPLRFILGNLYLKWALRITIITMLLFVLFEMKRRQRVIPVIEPLKNTSLEFVQTVGNVYFNKKDNKNIAEKKIGYFLEFIRSAFYLNTGVMDNTFIEMLTKKSGVQKEEVNELVRVIRQAQQSGYIDDDALLQLNELIDDFYSKAK